MIHHVEPIEVKHLFPALDKELVSLLRSLTPEEWNKSTIAKKWTVKDIAAHLLDGNLRTLSFSRDNYFGEQPGDVSTYHNLVIYLNKLNADWVTATRRLSPRVITDLLESTGKEYAEHIATLDPW